MTKNYFCVRHKNRQKQPAFWTAIYLERLCGISANLTKYCTDKCHIFLISHDFVP